jgi:hypothetical protein
MKSPGHSEMMPPLDSDMMSPRQRRRVKYRQDVLEGPGEHACRISWPAQGKNFGKLLVKIA